MLFSYSNIQIREICENEKCADEQLGTKIALSLRKRLADLVAAETICELPLGKPVEIKKGLVKLTLEDDFILLLEANHVSNPELKNGDIDWNDVHRIKIIKIGNINDNI